MGGRCVALALLGIAPLLGLAASIVPAQVNGRGGTLKGSVKGPNGDPAAGASVSLTDPKGAGTLHVTATDGDGWFAFGKLETGSYKLTATMPGTNLQAEQETLVRAPFAAVSNLALAPPLAQKSVQPAALDSTPKAEDLKLIGEVTDRSGRPLTQVLLQLQREGHRGPGITLSTQPNGTFEIQGLQAAEYSLFVHRTGYSDILVESLRLGARPMEQIAIVLVPFSLDIKSELAGLSADADRLLPLEASDDWKFRSRGYDLPPPPSREE